MYQIYFMCGCPLTHFILGFGKLLFCLLCIIAFISYSLLRPGKQVNIAQVFYCHSHSVHVKQFFIVCHAGNGGSRTSIQKYNGCCANSERRWGLWTSRATGSPAWRGAPWPRWNVTKQAQKCIHALLSAIGFIAPQSVDCVSLWRISPDMS